MPWLMHTINQWKSWARMDLLLQVKWWGRSECGKKSVPIWRKNIPEEGDWCANTLRKHAWCAHSRARPVWLEHHEWETATRCEEGRDPIRQGGETRQGLRLDFLVWWEDCRPREGTGRMHMHFWDHSSCLTENRLEGTQGSQRDQQGGFGTSQ